VYNPATQKFLFIKHKKLKKWLQPGGHLEVNELPDDSAIREVFEETGLTVRLVGDRLPKETDQIRPFGIQRNILSSGQHEHLDLIYLAVLETGGGLVQNTKETNGIGWFLVDEIVADGFDTFPAQKQWVQYFYDLMNKYY
jgi:8-oxo-dGTP pyrophosphatase MutT (NUDIX family)